MIIMIIIIITIIIITIVIIVSNNSHNHNSNCDHSNSLIIMIILIIIIIVIVVISHYNFFYDDMKAPKRHLLKDIEIDATEAPSGAKALGVFNRMGLWGESGAESRRTDEYGFGVGMEISRVSALSDL